MRTVWKYTLEPSDLQHVVMPRGAALLCVGGQEGELRLWAQVDTERPEVRRLIAVHGTGHVVKALDRNDGKGGTYPKYVGTATVLGGELVLHVYDHGEL